MTSPTSYRRLIDVETTSCVYWVTQYEDHYRSTNSSLSQIGNIPNLVFTPVTIAVADPAESAVCASLLYVFESATFLKVSQLSTFSSPIAKSI